MSLKDFFPRKKVVKDLSFVKMAGNPVFVAGTECVGKFNFIGSAAHVSINKVTVNRSPDCCMPPPAPLYAHSLANLPHTIVLKARHLQCTK